MDQSEKLFELLRNTLQQLPSLLTLLGCTIVALLRWKRHPKVSLVLALGLMFLFAVILIFATAFLWIPFNLVNRVFGSFVSPQFSMVLSLTYNTGLAIGLALLLMSIFMQRKIKLR